MPLWVRKFITDFVETGLAALFALTFVIPTTLDGGREVLLLVGAAIAGALVSAARRAIPAFIVWLNEKLGTTSA
jgi:predicted Co/Zn/Cd cation transporter (cation efflux family)